MFAIRKKKYKPPVTPEILKAGQFAYNVLTPAKSAATVWKDGKMIRSIYGNKPKSAGRIIDWWDGKDDFGVNVPAGSYNIRGLNANVVATWQGAIGNSSTEKTGSKVHRGFERVFGVAIAGSYMYLAIGYNEGRNSQMKVLLSTPQENLRAFQNSIGADQDQESNHVCTDGTRIYWGGVDPKSTGKNTSFVFGTLASDDSEVLFSSGSAYDGLGGRTYPKALTVVTNSSGRITGMAVQSGGSGYLFVARKGLNNLYVLDKLTGALTQTISISNINKVAVDSSNNLWVQSGTSATKYTVNGDGTITTTGVTVSGLVSVEGIGCNETDLWVMDGGSSQQIKVFNSSGASIKTLGQVGGYATNATVADDKFYFNDPANRINTSAITHAGDGSYFVIDPGNYRIQKYNSSDVFQTRIQYMPHLWSARVFQDGSTVRAFADYLEFTDDPTVDTLTSWTHTKNWGYNVPANRDDEYKRLAHVNKFSNGRTYALQPNGQGWEFVELVEGGTMRFTGVMITQAHSQMYPDQTIRRQNATNTVTNLPQIFYKRPFTFDGSNNPVLGTEVIIETSPNETAADPLYWGTRPVGYSAGEQTSDGGIISWDPNSDAYGSTGHHLGKLLNGQWVWKTMFSIGAYHRGEFPNAPLLDEGNAVGNAGGRITVIDDFIFVVYHGEFWKSWTGEPGQVNKVFVFNTDGILITIFGTTYWDIKDQGEAAAGMVGNGFYPSVIKVGSDYYLYQNDESFHGGITRWKITGLGTEKKWSYPITVTPPVAKVITDKIDLLEGLSPGGVNMTNGNGWTISDTNYVTTNESTNYWRVRTGLKTATKFEPQDIYMEFGGNSVREKKVERALPAETVTSYEIEGSVNYDRNYPNTSNRGHYFEVLDISDKVIARFAEEISLGGSFPITVKGNGVTIATAAESAIKRKVEHVLPLKITVNSGGVTFTYSDYTPVTTAILDGTADWTQPRKIRAIFFWNSGLSLQSKFGINTLYYSRVTGATPTNYLHLSAAEIPQVRQRLAGGPYKTKGDTGRTNSFGDGDQVFMYANQLVNNPLIDYYTGPTKNQDGTTITSSNPVKAWATPGPDRNGLRIGTRLLASAFLGAVLENGTAKTNYINAAKTCILNQVDITKYPNLDFSNTGSSGMWRTNQIGDINPGFEIAEWLGSFLISYDYVKSNFTSGQRTTIETWLFNSATYFKNLLNAQNTSYFLNRLGGNYAFTSHNSNENDVIDTTHDGGYTIRRFSLHWNNRLESIGTYNINSGVFFNDESMIDSGVRYSKELITYAMYPNGMTADMERASTDKERGLSYFGGQVGNFANQISVLGRSGRYDLIDFQTNAGAYGTESPTVPKSIKLAFDALASMYCKDKGWTKDGELLDGNFASLGWYSVLDALMAPGNLYYRDEKIRKVMYRVQPGCNPYPTNPAGNGPIPATFGNGNYFPGVGLLYFYDNYSYAPNVFVR
jgi:hypothetical protein